MSQMRQMEVPTPGKGEVEDADGNPFAPNVCSCRQRC